MALRASTASPDICKSPAVVSLLALKMPVWWICLWNLTHNRRDRQTGLTRISCSSSYSLASPDLQLVFILLSRHLLQHLPLHPTCETSSRDACLFDSSSILMQIGAIYLLGPSLGTQLCTMVFMMRHIIVHKLSPFIWPAVHALRLVFRKSDFR